ncbi:MAG: PAQR family membrane homeostasis protein TrhA [Solirubrobacterales bacterium]
MGNTTEMQPVKPLLRGVSHQVAAIVFAGLGIALVIVADGSRATTAAAIYAFSVVALFTTSAAYHRITWATARARLLMRRLDHSMIFVMIAGTYTPFALLVLDGTLATVILVTVWAGAGAGITMHLLWTTCPKWLSALTYIALGWVALVPAKQLIEGLGPTGISLVGAGGLLYTVGAIIYARGRPDPSPRVFGYHEIFHILVVTAAALHFAVVAFHALPKG